MKKMLVIAATAIFLFSLSACQKKEEQPAEQKTSAPSGPIIDTPASPPPGHGAPAQKTEFQVVVPPEVAGLWPKVTIAVNDKKTNKQQEFTLNVGEELNIPDSNLMVRIGPFLPDFKMSATVITSASNEPNNPSVGIAVFENGNKLFPATGEWGWLYTKFPDIHSFQHERFSLALKEGVKK